MNQISIPPRFYRDRAERDLPAPPILRDLRPGYVIDADHPDFAELVSDAKHYANGGLDEAPPQVVSSAKALLRAVTRQMVRV